MFLLCSVLCALSNLLRGFCRISIAGRLSRLCTLTQIVQRKKYTLSPRQLIALHPAGCKSKHESTVKFQGRSLSDDSQI
ncbi:hypothetical protein M758_8G075100 [Ceratodon purpureus]|nr:hypothetical protein M758_8G075100 [Ceratodon purpureus]